MRSEIKYLVPRSQLSGLRDAIAPMVTLDRYCADFENVGYTVRSIYLDTPMLLFYHEKLEGLKKRKKLRIRAYNELTPETQVFLEIKRKIESRIKKDRAGIAYGKLPRIFEPLQTSGLRNLIGEDKNSLTAANSFLFHLHKSRLQCVNLVVYEREAFESKIDPNLRITFDRNLRTRLSSNPSLIFSEDDLSQVLPAHFILEVKYDHKFPVWLADNLSNLSLQKQALSKYCMCLERCTGLQGKALLMSLRAGYLDNTPHELEERVFDRATISKAAS